MTKKILNIGAALWLFCHVACATGTSDGVSSLRQELASKSIGDGCAPAEDLVSQDEQVSISREQQIAIDRGEPVVFTVLPGFDDESSNLEEGTLFCLAGTPGSEFPNGYVTARCSSDKTCGDGNVCDGGLCRRPCESDKECLPPTVCAILERDPAPLRFCRCLKCAL
jgi:hypothetical protein